MISKVGEELKLRLKEELRVRNGQLLYPHYGLIFLTILINQDFFFNNPLYFYPLGQIVFFLLLRYYILKKHFDDYVKEKKLTMAIFDLSVMGTGLGWGLFYYHQLQVTQDYFSMSGIFGLGVTIVVMSGIVTALSSALRSAILFLISVAAIPVCCLLSSGESKIQLVGLLVLGNLLYSIHHAIISNRFLMGVLRDILNESKQRESLQEFMDAFPGIVAVVDENLTYSLVNNFAQGKYRKILLGKKVGSYPPAGEIAKLIIKFHQSPKKTDVQEVFTIEDDHEDWWMITLRKLDHQKGIVVSLSVITELVETRKELRLQEARAQYSAKLASLGEMGAGIAHEINNPLTIIEGYSDMISKLVQNDVIDKETLLLVSEKISQTTVRITKIVKSLKTLAKNANSEPISRIDLKSIIEPCLEVSRQKIMGHDISLRLPVSKHEEVLYGREIQITQVLMNLLTNSIDAVSEMNEKWIEIDFIKDAVWCDILLKDSGPGVPEDIRERIMEPFFTTKGLNQGTGLGLSISKSIIENQGGELALLSGTNHTTFRIRLPNLEPIDTL